jgi:hypothetical protein
MGPTAPTELRALLGHDVQRALFHVVREHLEANGSKPGHRRRDVVRQAAEAAEIGMRQMNGGAETAPELADRFGCSVATIDRRRRLLRDALKAALNGTEGMS